VPRSDFCIKQAEPEMPSKKVLAGFIEQHIPEKTNALLPVSRKISDTLQLRAETSHQP